MTSLYTLLQLSDSLFPSGAFAHSYGLESLLSQCGRWDVAQLQPMLAALWEHHLLRSDGLIALHTHRAMLRGDINAVCELDRRLFAMKLTRELRAASTDTGRSFVVEARSTLANSAFDMLCTRVQTGDSPGTYAAMFAAAAAAADVNEQAMLLAWSYQSIAQLVAALLRLGVIGHRAAVCLVSGVRPLVEIRVRDVLACNLDDLSSFAPQLEIASMRHERQYSRLFRS